MPRDAATSPADQAVLHETAPAGAAARPLRLNLGSGPLPLPGYEPWDIKGGREAFPLTLADASVDEIRASHLLEHFSHRLVHDVLTEWVRVLKPGGLLKIAVPDFKIIAEKYLACEDIPVQGYVMGGHSDAADRHGCIFDEEELRDQLAAVGLVDIVRWQSEIADCASLPISLNLQGRKPDLAARAPRRPWQQVFPNVSAAMSVPRLGFMDNFFCAFSALSPLRIGLRKQTGAFWGQCLERAIEGILEEGADVIITIDYDTVFTRQHVETLLQLLADHPEADAIAPVQASRARPGPLMTMRGIAGKNLARVPVEVFEPDLAPVATAHFGLTVIRAAALRDLPKPWFKGEPDAEGRWSDGRTDDDIYFWRNFERAGRRLFLANRVAVGHAELLVMWPGEDFKPLYQHASEFYRDGAPQGVWK